eukprot:c17083_g1_i1 orf=328-2385(+)
MSPSKQKSTERQIARDRKALVHQAAASGGTVASAYNPSSGTFHTLEPLNPDTGAPYLNGRFKSIDDADDNASSNGGGADVDCMSNNGSYSGESEDQLHTNGKDKNGSGKPGTCGADKRDKIRGKNERKHQRQKERRAQELRDKCTGYLMSRKLEALAQKLVAMGFSQERATMALIVNDGHLEQSVAWLLEGGEGQVQEDRNTSGNPKIDISEELGHILEIEKKYNFSRPNIERAVVSCEGDLDKALECLRACGRSTSPSREEEREAQSRLLEDSKEELPASSLTMLRSPVALQPRSNAALQPSHHQSRRDEGAAALSSEGRLHASSFNSYVSLEGRSAHLWKHSNSLTDPQSSVPSAERRGFVQGTFPPVSVKGAPLGSPFTTASNADAGLVFGFGTPDPRLISVPNRDYIQNVLAKEPAYAGQMHSFSHTSFQPIVAQSNCPPVSSPAFSPSSWSHGGLIEGGSPSSVLHVNGTQGDLGLKGIRAVKNSMESYEFRPLDSSGQLNPFVSMQLKSQASQWNGLGKGLSYEISSAPSNSTAHSGSPSGTSYGLFTGWGAGLFQSSVDWSTGPMQNCDYRNIDWSMNAPPTSVQGVSSQLNSMLLQEKSSHQWNLEGERRFQTGLRAARFLTESTNGHGIWKGGSSGAGMQDNISMDSGNTTAHEWTSPFAGKALFNLPQTVSSPSL